MDLQFCDGCEHKGECFSWAYITGCLVCKITMESWDLDDEDIKNGDLVLDYSERCLGVVL